VVGGGRISPDLNRSGRRASGQLSRTAPPTEQGREDICRSGRIGYSAVKRRRFGVCRTRLRSPFKHWKRTVAWQLTLERRPDICNVNRGRLRSCTPYISGTDWNLLIRLSPTGRGARAHFLWCLRCRQIISHAHTHSKWRLTVKCN